jgi:transcriptional regulator with XRE-family HTH domain
MSALDLGRAAVQPSQRTPVGLPEVGSVSASDDAPHHRPSSWRIPLAEIDRHVSRRIRARRIALGLTQDQLAQRIGVTFQQLHKYEVGANRVSAGRLEAIARALGVDVADFFVGQAGQATHADELTLEFARAFVGIGNQRHQRAVALLVRLLAGVPLDPEAGQA